MVKNKNWFILIIGICLLASLATVIGCSSGTPTTTPTPTPTSTPGTPNPNAPAAIKIGGAIPLTGTSSSGGVDLFFGYSQAVKDINATGGVYVAEYGTKIPLSLKLVDDESDASKTVSRLEQLNSVDHVVAYLGTYSSELNAAAAPIAEKNRIPIVAVAFSNLSPHQQGYKYLFSPFVKTTQGVESIFELLNTLGSKKPTKIGIWAEQSDWGVEIAKSAPEMAKKYGYQVVQNQMYDITTIDFSSFILQAKQAGVEVPIAIPIPATAITIGKQMKELDYNPLTYVLWRGAGAASWPKTMGKDGNGALYIANWDWHYSTPGTKDLVDNYRALNSAMPSVNVGSAYAAVQVLADAIERAGTLNSGKIRDALAATKNLETIEGTLQGFDGSGIGIMPSSVMQWQNMISQVVWPDEFASSKFIYPLPTWSNR
jgi:branched-chain amino acid transport system substrate-binding protein